MIVVFGSLNIDMVMSVKTMPRPGDTVLCPSYKLVPGGKGANQAVAAARAGAEVKFFGKVGNDELGKIAVKSLEDNGVDLTGLSKCDVATGCAMVCVDAGGENMIAVASGANALANQSEIPDFLLSKDHTVVMQLETPLDQNWDLIERAKKIGARTILNLAPAHGIPVTILESIDVLVLNQIEATTLALHLGFDVISPSVAARRISTNFGITCIVTLGAEGAIACSPDGVWQVQAMPIQAIDTTAAGDAFVGVLAASLDSGMALPEALSRASVASGLVCTQSGAQSSLPLSNLIDQAIIDLPMPLQIA
ncbi:Ribokinase [Candidatus Bealeia paramacronuclearis]|uniref:Ribokinase n=2 Tax=Candidatus Bealeia paramacronuclearis TaxID=1921001 RepID=A0ABZ2C5K5_9PROT|nr:Ribokinase [Candidatus Bealeia paramacronuclearis]